MSPVQTSKSSGEKPPHVPIPSASVLLISPSNQILLLHRVQSSKSFPSAHVFPGGNLESEQDGEIPGPEDAMRHEDSMVYRLAAIRECFEESGILLAKKLGSSSELIKLSDELLGEGRRSIYENKVGFKDWVAQHGGYPDTENLIPFTRWITPTNVPKRFSVQMYLYFLPLRNPSSMPGTVSLLTQSETIIPKPTSDGGIEHTSARFLPPSKWLSLCASDRIILFPPQFFLLHLISPFLSPENAPSNFHPEDLAKQREELLDFVKGGDPPWAEKCMSPNGLYSREHDGRVVMSANYPGLELEGSGRRGDAERVMLMHYRKGVPRNPEVRWRKDMVKDHDKNKERL